MSRSWLWDVDGVSTMINVTEMYLAYNEISELGPFSMLENLNLLDLEGFVSLIIQNYFVYL